MIEYPKLNYINNVVPYPHILLGKEIYWTIKEDGSNIGCYIKEGELLFRSRNMEVASPQFTQYMKATEQHDGIWDLLCDASTWNSDYVIFGELCIKGKSPTRINYHTDTHFIVFDIWSAKQNCFMNYTQVYQRCHHFDLPIVDLLGTCNVTSMESLMAFRDQMLEHCKEINKEGTVGKTWGSLNEDGYLFFKEKNDTPKIEKLPRLVEDGTIELPILPESEIYGAINKVHVDIGDDIHNIKVAMPKVAEYVREECCKHGCRLDNKKLITYYKEYLEDFAPIVDSSP